MNGVGRRGCALAVAAACTWTVFADGLGSQVDPQTSFKSLIAAPGLEVKLWSAEPDVVNPTVIAVDERGRVWAAEGVNYRSWASVPVGGRGNPAREVALRPTGDRIVILEDVDGDGKADKSKVFDEGPHIQAPIGIAVLGDKVYLSQSPDLVVYTKDADDKIVSKETLLTGFAGINHDHGLHSIVFGPDGRLYFNAGNAGMDVTDKSGKRIVAGEVSDAPTYFGGVPLRMNEDGTELTVLAQNFRNPYETAVDSFGTIWQTDNDDDGNAWTRLNYVMEGGNFGHRGPYLRSWQSDNSTHWHEELAGVAPGLMRLGAGAPTGLAVYEGTLLPARFQSQLLHAENSKRALRAYMQSDAGAGYATKIEDALHSADPWFRPSDVAVAPDGAVYVSDWYDSLTGGHGMADSQNPKGRIYRLAPPNHKAAAPALDLQNTARLTAAFRSPNQSVSYLAHKALQAQGQAALPALEAMWKQKDAVLRARALWLLGGLGPAGSRHVQDATRDPDARFRILALRVMRRYGADMVAATKALLRDRSPQVRREIALLLQDPSAMTPAYLVGDPKPSGPGVVDAIVELGRQYGGKDRWYLSAIGIAARGREDAVFAQLREVYPGNYHPSLTALVWEMRPKSALPYLTAAINNFALSVDERMKALDALAGMQWPEATAAVEALILSERTPAPLVERAFGHYRHQLVSMWTAAAKGPTVRRIVTEGLSMPALQLKAIELASALNSREYTPPLIALAMNTEAPEPARLAAIDAAVGLSPGIEMVPDFEALAMNGSPAVRAAGVRALGRMNIQPSELEEMARKIFSTDAPNDVRAEALRLLMRTAGGINTIADLEEKGQFPMELKALARTLVNGRGFGGRGFAGRGGPGGGRGGPAGRGGPGPGGAPADPAVVAALTAARERAIKVFPPIVAKGNATLTSIGQMEKDYRADAAAGRRVFESEEVRCAACHSVGGTRKLGPDLAAVGTKFGKQGILDSILMPSAAISFGFETSLIETKGGEVVTGVVTEDTPTRITVKTDSAQDVRLRPADIVSRKQSVVSTMPEGLINALTPQQVVDLLEYLAGLKGATGVSSR